MRLRPNHTAHREFLEMRSRLRARYLTIEVPRGLHTPRNVIQQKVHDIHVRDITILGQTVCKNVDDGRLDVFME